LPNVSITTSSERNLKLFQRVESTIAVWISRVFFGQAVLLIFIAFFFAFFSGMGTPESRAMIATTEHGVNDEGAAGRVFFAKPCANTTRLGDSGCTRRSATPATTAPVLASRATRPVAR
jgi:hypothetical protein